MANSGDVLTLVVAMLRDDATTDAQRARAFAVPVARWERILGLDGCAVQFNHALQRSGHHADAPAALRRLLADATSTALHRALLVHSQLPAVATLAAASGVRVMALKGAARLLGGELPATRSISDIDLLVAPSDALALHGALQRELGYASDDRAYPHHLAGLTRGGSLGIEIHTRLTPTPLPLDTAIWRGTRRVDVAGHSIELPSATNVLLHTLEHAVRVNWTGRYRLRDVLDVAALLGPEVDMLAVAAYLTGSDCRRPMVTLFEAARGLRAPASEAGEAAWSTVRRVGRTRSMLGAIPRAPLIAERWFRYAGAIAEGSPRTLARLGLELARRFAGRTAAVTLAAMAAIGVASCDSTTAPSPFLLRQFVFAVNTPGQSALYRWRDGAVTRLSAPGDNDREPQSAGNKLVFTSLRDGYPEIYLASLNADLTLGAQTKLTADSSTDADPALNPSGTTIAFQSRRSGTPRLWLMDANGANQHALDTGSPDYVPEGSPRWSPTGDRIAFTSTRTGGSQVYVVPSAGGVATQLSHETRGAYTPSWLPNGTAVIYMALGGPPLLRSVPVSGGEATLFASDTLGVGEPACSRTACLAVLNPLGGTSRIVALTISGKRAGIMIPRVNDDHHPALLGP